MNAIDSDERRVARCASRDTGRHFDPVVLSASVLSASRDDAWFDANS